MPRKTPATGARRLAEAARFNEAAARCRGKPYESIPYFRAYHMASMRPRPDAAENARTGPPPACRSSCFNEAAARCRGKPACCPGDAARAAGLQ